MSLTAYCPIARGKVVGDPILDEIGKAHGKSATQVALRWLVQQEGVIAIPRSSNEARIARESGRLRFHARAGRDGAHPRHGLAHGPRRQRHRRTRRDD
jgi:diketogulonate reductase-like aldo/keto reductase